uniref:Reverse transcriptase domain-containing protein n=1 Tax=Tanacetum cinerariifolium TaxID=118510 RepID=A0A6L2KKU6_TANCI|nr:reverse transcriptase domain-containing protein [Tanacetum cinerariifolium]
MAGQAPPQGPIPDLCSLEELLQAPTDGVGDAIVVPSILANQSELKIANGNFLTKNTQEALTIIENKSKVQASRNKTQVASASGSSTQDAHVTALTKQVGAFCSSFNQPINSVQNSCEMYGGPYPYYECQAAGGYTQEEVERDPEMIMDQVPTESTIRALPLVVQSPPAPVSFEIPHPPTLSFFELPNGPPKKLPEKLGDPGRFPIPCDFYELESCMALADLGASINLMTLSVWKKLSLPDLTPTRMTLELATKSIAFPPGKAEDVCVQVGKFTFPADFVVVDPHVPLILGRPFLKTAHALVNVHGEELILRDGDEKLIFHADSTSKHPHKHGNESINMINFIDITCEDHFLKVLKIKKLNHPSSGSTAPLSDSLPSLAPFETSDSLLEEFAEELAILDPFPTGNEDNNFDPEADLRKIEYLLNRDPSTESDIDIFDPILERFTDEHALNYSPPPRDDDDDLFDPKSDNDEWKKLLYDDFYKDIDFEKDKNKDSKMKLLIDEANIFESNVLLP